MVQILIMAVLLKLLKLFDRGEHQHSATRIRQLTLQWVKGYIRASLISATGE